jgi:Ca2+-binding RTX toxin-like protein
MSNYKAILSGQSWNAFSSLKTGKKPVFLTYSFNDVSWGSSKFGSADKAMAKKALKMWGDASGIRFLEVKRGDAELKFQWQWAWYDASAWAEFPKLTRDTFDGWQDQERDESGGNVYLNSRYRSEISQNSNFKLYLMLHEIGHALGLKHPFHKMPHNKKLLGSDLDNVKHTVMSYTGGDIKMGPVQLGALDIEAIRALYGNPSQDGRQVAKWSWSKSKETLSQTGKSKADIIYGVNAKDIIKGANGNDKVFGFAGRDSLYGGSGNDVLSGGDGNDKLFGDIGNDVLRGGHGDDIVQGATGNDNLGGGYGNDSLYGDLGNDALKGDDGNDTLYGGAGTDILDGGDDNDTLHGDNDNDVLSGKDGDDTLQGGDGNDNVDGGDDDDILYGDIGDDTLNGGYGSDIIHGGAGNDAFAGGLGIDTVSYVNAASGVTADLGLGYGNGGEALGDRFSEVENLTGSTFNDQLAGDAGANRLLGDTGNDVLNGKDGVDTLEGGLGDDILSGGSGGDVLIGGEGQDLADYGNASFAIVASLSETYLNTLDAAGDSYRSIEGLSGSAFADRLIGDWNANVLVGNAGDDNLDGGFGDDILQGGVGNDTLTGGINNDTLLGDDNNDSLDGEYGNDTLYGGIGNDSLSGGSGADDLQGGGDIDTLNGGHEDDTLSGGYGNDILVGYYGADVLQGGDGNDNLEGEYGEDTLRGGAGSDTLIGGADNDQYVFDTWFNGVDDVDQIVYFEGDGDQDKIVLSSAIFSTLERGELSSDAFSSTRDALDAADRILFDGEWGFLSYDPDGTGAVAAVRFAKVSGPWTVNYHDVLIV